MPGPLGRFPCAGIGGADKIVVGQLQFFGERPPVRRQFVTILLRRFALGDSRLLNLLAVFIQTGQEKNIQAETAARPRDDVGDDFLVGMAEVRLAVDVVNGGGDVKLFVHYRAVIVTRYSAKASAEKGPAIEGVWFKT